MVKKAHDNVSNSKHSNDTITMRCGRAVEGSSSANVHGYSMHTSHTRGSRLFVNSAIAFRLKFVKNGIRARFFVLSALVTVRTLDEGNFMYGMFLT